MQDFIMVGANIAVALTGLLIGVYFAVRVVTLRGKIDDSTHDLFIAISVGAIFGSIHRLHALPVYVSRVTDDVEGVGLLYRFSHWAVIAVLVFCAYGYILHLKPVFYWISRPVWAAMSLVFILLLVVVGAVTAQLLTLI